MCIRDRLWTLTGIPNNDGTIAWDVPRTIPNTTGQAFFVGSGPANELFDGTILIWVYVEDVGGANMKMFVLRSIDHGVSFGSPILVWDGENVIECGENSAIQVPSGLIVNVIRAQNYDSSSNRYSKVTSSDGGLTWSAPVDVIQTGASISHPSLIQTRSGALHLTGSVSTGEIVGSRPTCDWTSWDNGETWTATRPWLWPDGSNNYCDDYGGQCLLSGGNIGAVTAEIYDGYLISVYTGIFYHQYSDGYGLFSGVDAGIARLNKTVLSNGTVITDGTYKGSNAVFFTTSDGTSYALTLPPHP